jgi:hypothetical protein
MNIGRKSNSVAGKQSGKWVVRVCRDIELQKNRARGSAIPENNIASSTASQTLIASKICRARIHSASSFGVDREYIR